MRACGELGFEEFGLDLGTKKATTGGSRRYATSSKQQIVLCLKLLRHQNKACHSEPRPGTVVRFCTSISFGERLKLVFQEPHSPKREGVTLDTEQSVVLSSLRNAGNLQLLLSWCLSPDQTPRNQARRMPSLKKQKFRKKSNNKKIDFFSNNFE